MLGVLPTPGSELFIAVAGQDRTTACPTPLFVCLTIGLILACFTFTTCLTLAPLSTFTAHSALTGFPTFAACLIQFFLSVIASSSLRAAVFMSCVLVQPGMLPGGGILWVRLWRDLGPLVLLVL